MHDFDNSGYTAFAHVRVNCTHADGVTETIAGLSAPSFTLTGNGVTAQAPEDVVTGTASADGKATYLLQLYRHFSPASALTAAAETVTINGTDTYGRTINASGTISLGNPVLPSFYAGVGDGASPAGARTIDSDGKGFSATAFYAMAYGVPSAGTCPTLFNGTIRDYLDTSANVRYCGFLGAASSFTYYSVQSSGYNTSGWPWSSGTGANAFLTPDVMQVNSASLATNTDNGNRMPIYKVQSTIHYSAVPPGGFANMGVSNIGQVFMITIGGAEYVAASNAGLWNW